MKNYEAERDEMHSRKDLQEYKLRKEDFIPFVGLAKHHKRSINEMFRKHLVGNDYYAAQAGARDALLSLYNSALFIGALFGVAKGIELLVK